MALAIVPGLQVVGSILTQVPKQSDLIFRLHHHRKVEHSRYRQGLPLSRPNRTTRSIALLQSVTLAREASENGEARAELLENARSPAITLGHKIWRRRPLSQLILNWRRGWLVVAQ